MNVSKETYEKRINEIYKACEVWAFDKGKHWFISMWELADNINNGWGAKYFFTLKEMKKQGISYSIHYNDFHLEHFELYNYLTRLTTTVRKIKGSKIIRQKGKYNMWFKIPKRKRLKI